MLLFADDQVSVWIVGVGGVCTLVGGGIAWLWTAVAAKRKTTMGEWQDIAERERELRYRAESRNSNLEASFRRMFTLYSDARSRSLDFFSLLLLQTGVIKRQNERLEKLGEWCEDGLELPTKPTDATHLEADFLFNTVQQEKIAADSAPKPDSTRRQNGNGKPDSWVRDNCKK